MLQCSEFISHVEKMMIDEHWSVDAAVGRAAATGQFDKMLCTKTIYNYIDLGLLKVKNTDLPCKLRRSTKKVRHRINKRKPGDSIGAPMKTIMTLFGASYQREKDIRLQSRGN